MEQQLLSLPQAALRLGVSRVWLWQQVKARHIPAVRVGRFYGIDAAILHQITPPKIGRPPKDQACA